MIRAFRLNDRVRELLLPLLPGDLLKSQNSSVSGVDVKAQVEAFEVTFQRMDADGSNAVTMEEFAAYFGALGLGQPKGRKARKGAGVLTLGKQGKPERGRRRNAPPLHEPKHVHTRDPGGGKGGHKGRRQREGSPTGGELRSNSAPSALPLIKAHNGTPAPGLQRMLQMSYTDTWRKPVATQRPPMSPRALTSPRSAGTLAVAGTVANVRASARAELERAAGPGGGGGGLVLSPRGGGGREGGAEPPSYHGAHGMLTGGGDAALLPSLSAAGGGKAAERAGGDDVSDHWAPSVQSLAIMPAAPAAAPGGRLAQLEDWELEYLATETPLRFEVHLPSSQEYVPRFRFSGDDAGRMGGGQGGGGQGKLISWVAAAPAKLSNRVAAQLGRRHVGSKIAEELGFKGFALPNGKTLRLFHASTKRNWRAPPVEPDEPLPDGLATLALPGMPPPPPPPQPSKRDLPKLTQSELRCLRPKKEDRSAESAMAAAYSTLIEEERFVIHVQPGATGSMTDMVTKSQKATGANKFELFESVFAPRRLAADSRNFYDDEQVTLRAFEIDFARCNQERFRLLIRSEDDDTAAAIAEAEADGVFDESEVAGTSEAVEIGEIKQVLCRHRDTVNRAFAYWSALGAVDERCDGFSIGEAEYEDFYTRCKLPDRNSSACRKEDLVDIFQTTNEEEATGLAENSEMNVVNADRALLRFEFQQCLVRIAIAKYVHAGERTSKKRGSMSTTEKIADVSEALEALLTRDVAPNLPPEARVVPDVFRERRLYSKPIAEALERAETMLHALFDFYAASMDDQDAPDAKPVVAGGDLYARTLNLSLDEWLTMLDDAGLIDDDLTRQRAILCFVWSQPCVTDEVRRREKMQHLSYIDFCEALCRILAFKPLPSNELLRTYNAKSAAHFFEQVERGEHEGAAQMRRAFDWREERDPNGTGTGGAALRPYLEILISLIFERLSTSDEMLTRKELKKRLERRAQAKRDAIEAQRLAEEEAAMPERMFGAMAEVLAGGQMGGKSDIV